MTIAVIILYVIVTGGYLMMFIYVKKRDWEMPHYHPTDAEQIRAHKEKKQVEHLKRINKLFDEQTAKTIDVRFLDQTGNGKGYVK